MSNATFCAPDLTIFAGLNRLGLAATGLRIDGTGATIACVPTNEDGWCPVCGGEGRRLAHLPLGWRPTTLLVEVPRYRCRECGRCWRHDLTRAAEPRSRLSRAAVWWGLEALVVDRLSIARIAAHLGVCWDTTNDTLLDAGQRLLSSGAAGSTTSE